jgi:lipoprotein-anchoring transpeptidase ErfK/SrfK
MIIFGFGLAPGTFAAEKGTGINKKIIVVIDTQILLAMEGSKVVYEYDVVTGRPKKETHPGDYRIGRKYKDYTSKTYGSPMPYSMFFSKDGKAIHGTEWATVRSYLHAYVTESVGSHGCVGLSEEDAKILFDWTPVGTPIEVVADQIMEAEE